MRQRRGPADAPDRVGLKKRWTCRSPCNGDASPAEIALERAYAGCGGRRPIARPGRMSLVRTIVFLSVRVTRLDCSSDLVWGVAAKWCLTVVCGISKLNQRDFRPCATVTRHRTDMVKSKSETTITVRNEPSVCSHMGNKRTSSKPAKAWSPRRMPTPNQKILLPHAGRKENTIVANSNMMYAATANQPATSWKCS